MDKSNTQNLQPFLESSSQLSEQIRTQAFSVVKASIKLLKVTNPEFFWIILHNNLSEAAKLGKAQIVEHFLKPGNLIQSKMNDLEDAYNRCVLDAATEAAREGHLNVIRVILDKGTSTPNASKLKIMFAAIQMGAEHGHEHIVQDLLSNYPPPELIGKGFIGAVVGKQQSLALKLLDSGIAIRQPDFQTLITGLAQTPEILDIMVKHHSFLLNKMIDVTMKSTSLSDLVKSSFNHAFLKATSSASQTKAKPAKSRL